MVPEGLTGAAGLMMALLTHPLLARPAGPLAWGWHSARAHGLRRHPLPRGPRDGCTQTRWPSRATSRDSSAAWGRCRALGGGKGWQRPPGGCVPVRWSRLAGQVLGRPSTCTARKGHEEGARPPAPWDSPVGPLPPGTAPGLSGPPLATFSKLKMSCPVNECRTLLGSLFYRSLGESSGHFTHFPGWRPCPRVADCAALGGVLVQG